MYTSGSDGCAGHFSVCEPFPTAACSGAKENHETRPGIAASGSGAFRGPETSTPTFCQ